MLQVSASGPLHGGRHLPRLRSAKVKQLRRPRAPSSTLLSEPSLAPLRRHSRLPNARDLAALDALVVLGTTVDPNPGARLPGAEHWRTLQGREPARALQLRGMTLANARQTFALLGYVKPGASSFERLGFAGRLLRELAARRPRRLGLLVPRSVPERAAWCEALLSAAWTESYHMPGFQSTPPPRWLLERIALFDAPQLAPAPIQASARAGNLVRALTALPPNRLDARGFRRLLTVLARRHGLALRWYSERQLRALGAGAFLAVARGNAERTAGIAHLRWRGARAHARRAHAPDVALVGKGILFDTGGINLKQHRHMLDMHTDMSGSAVALATLLALSELKADLRADAWLAVTENNIGPRAYRPQEVVRAANGTTIQVIHSDAEGRMVLADTLALAARTRPRLTIDFATLTGAAVHALTERYSAVFTNRPEFAAPLVAAGAASGERVWHFPLDPDFDSDLESPVADIMQCAVDGKGDHILAARFLSRFIGERNPWVHVDLSAATRRGGLAHVGTEVTGFGVRFALELLLAQRLHARTDAARA
jgi:leucyl aminopeptidase